MYRLLIICGWIAGSLISPLTATNYSPPEGQRLLIIGQDLGAIGQFSSPNNDGYCDYFSNVPAGFTSYTSLKNLEGLWANANYGNGDMFANKIIEHADLKGTVLCMGLYIVGILNDINTGQYDQNIKSLALWLKGADVPVYLRIGYEFNGAHNAYDKSDYKLAYKHIVDGIRAQGVSNVAYVWQSDGQGSKSELLQWYPGDDYVDWMGYSHFWNKGDSMIALAQEKKKPVMIAEATPQGKNLSTGDGVAIWAQWFAPLFKHIEDYPEVQALCYINTDWDSKSMWEGQGWGDTRVHKSDTIARLWQEEISGNKWIGKSDDVYQLIGFNANAISDVPKGQSNYELESHNGEIKIKSDVDELLVMKLYNTCGQCLFDQEVLTNNAIQVSGLNQGIYLALLESQWERVAVKKMIISK